MSIALYPTSQTKLIIFLYCLGVSCGMKNCELKKRRKQNNKPT